MERLKDLAINTVSQNQTQPVTESPDQENPTSRPRDSPIKGTYKCEQLMALSDLASFKCKFGLEELFCIGFCLDHKGPEPLGRHCA